MKKRHFTTILYIFFSYSLLCQTINLNNTGTTRAVVIGISDYQDPDIPNLRFAHKDAMAFANYLKSDAGGNLDKDQLILLTNENATSGQIGSALYWLLEESKENDQVIIYFSGHGDVERKFRGQPGFLLCWDAPPRVYISGGTLQLGMLQSIVSTLSMDNKAKVTIIMDACRSGKLAGEEIRGSQLTNSNLAQQYANEIKILSCQPDEYSIEGEEWGGGRGAFSYHLLNGLYGMADINNDLMVNLLEIGRYLEDHVTSEVAPKSQIPMTIGGRTERMGKVNPELLIQFRQKEKGQMEQPTIEVNEGLEEQVLATIDPAIKEQYFAFKKSIKGKNFLREKEDYRQPGEYFADDLYSELMKESKLKPLHSKMRLDFAAALQDDAQQVLNKLLKSDVSELGISKVKQSIKYKRYPRYLARASELLGKDHYLYPILQARRLYFEGYLMHIDNRIPDKELGYKALEKYRQSLEWEPESPQVYYQMMAVYFFQLMQADSAEYYAHKASSLAPSWIGPYSMMAWLYGQASNHSKMDKVKHFLELADQSDSTAANTNVWHMNNWGIYYKASFQWNEAEIQFKKIIQIDSSYSQTFNELAYIYFINERYDEAEKQYKKAISLDSTNARPFRSLGLIYAERKEFIEAEKQYKKAILLDSSNIESLAGLIAVHIRSNRFQVANTLIKKMIQLDSNNLRSYNNIGYAYSTVGRFEEAEKMFLKMTSIDPLSSRGYSNLGLLYYNADRYQEAEEMFLKVLEIDSFSLHGHWGLGAVYNRIGKYNKAEKVFLKYLEIDPESLWAHNYLGSVYMNAGRFEEAEKEFQKIIEIDSMNVGVHKNLGLFYSKTGNYNKAEKQIQEIKLLSIGEIDMYVSINYAVLYSLQNKIDKAYEHLEQAFQQGYKYWDFHLDPRIDPSLEILRKQKNRWQTLMKKYFPNKSKNSLKKE